MKKIFTILAASVLLLASCSKEVLDGPAPVIELDETELTAIIDDFLTISGTITAENGITGFTITNDAYSVNEVYDFSNMSHPAEYSFLCGFSVPEGLTSDETFTISVTDAAGKHTDATVPVKFLKDTSKAEVMIETEAFVYVDAVSGKGTYTIGMLIEDDQELDYVTFKCEALGLDDEEELYGSEAEVAYVIDNLTDGKYEVEVSVYDMTGNHTDNTVTIEAVTDTEDPTFVHEGESTIEYVMDETGSVTYTLRATVADNIALNALKIYCITSDWATTYSEETIDLYGEKEATLEREFTFTEIGSYAIYYYVNDLSTSIQSWGNDTEGYIYINVVSADKEAPTVEMNSSAYCQLGTPYTLKITVKDEGGIAQCWPKVCVYNENGTMPTEIADNWSGWWPEISGTECSAEQALTFTETGTYKVWIDPITDLAGNASEGKEWFTITVSTDPAGPSIAMTSETSATIGNPYTLKLTFKSPAGFPQCWPKVTVYNENGTMPTEIADNWSGWWPEVSGTECSVEQALTFTEAGTYSVWVDPVTDNEGAATEGKVWFTINVQ